MMLKQRRFYLDKKGDEMKWHGLNVPDFFAQPEFDEQEIDTLCDKHKTGQLQNLHLLLRARVSELLQTISHLKESKKSE